MAGLLLIGFNAQYKYIVEVRNLQIYLLNNMIIKDLIYVEMTPDEGKIFTNGKEITDYICMRKDLLDTSKWYEISYNEQIDTKDCA